MTALTPHEKHTLLATFTLACVGVFCVLICYLLAAVCHRPLTLADYKDLDYGFLATYPFGDLPDDPAALPTRTIRGQKFCLVSVTQFGAKGDGVSPNQDAFNNAVNYINQNLAGAPTILYLPAGSYRVTHEIHANDMRNVIFTGAGDNTVIFTDNDYQSWWEFFFNCWRDTDCFFGNFQIQARESWGQNRYYRQLTLIDCTNCYLYNLTLDVPETAWDGVPFTRIDEHGQLVVDADGNPVLSVDKQYTNLTLYAGDKNIVVDACTMRQMSGTYRGANIGIMDFYERGTTDITIKNCVLHDNARDEQVGIFSKSGVAASYIKGVNFTNNQVFTHPTPYRDVVGARTMCFTVAYGNNQVADINIAGNTFTSYADSKFMTFGAVQNCTVRDNQITVYANNGNAGYVFDSAAARDTAVVIDHNDFYLTYANSPRAGKCLSAGHLTFTNNNVLADCTMGKIADREGIYTHNNFQMLGAFGSCGSATQFNDNTVTVFGPHTNNAGEIFFNHIANGATFTDVTLTFIGNTVTDYTYYHDAKNQRPFDNLGVINQANITALIVTDNVYRCPNYCYASPDDYLWICWVRSGAQIANFVCENNDLQGAKSVYGATGGPNTLREFNRDAPPPGTTPLTIQGDRLSDMTVSGADTVQWLTFGTKAARPGDPVTVFAVATDGSGRCAKITVPYTDHTPNLAAIFILIIAALALVLFIAMIIVHCRAVRRRHA